MSQGAAAHTHEPFAKVVALSAAMGAESPLIAEKAGESARRASGQLIDSYATLESRVEELNQQLNVVADKRMQEFAEKERLANRLESLLNFLPGGVVVLDSSGRVSECNPAALDLLGEPLQGELWRDVITRSFSPRQDDGHEVSLRDGRRISIATRNLGGDGQIVLLTDQTETRRLQGELSRHERLSALGKMMSALAHQIRTPLSAAMLYAGHLCGDKLDDARRMQFSEKIYSRLNHIERQVQDMLLFVKGELPITDLISVAELHAELSEAMEVPLMTSNSHCQWVNNAGDYYLSCNRDALVNAIMNLVNNAIEAVERHAQLRIEFSINHLSRNKQPQLLIRVCDKGPGIAQDMLASVNDLFVTTKSHGTGLGLAVVQAVARAHHGRFFLQSKQQQGTCANLLLPLSAFNAEAR